MSSRERPSLALMCTDSIYIDDTSQISCSAITDLKSECRALKTNLGGAGSFKILRVTHLSLPGCRWEVGIYLKLGTNTKEIPTKYQKHSRAAALSGIEISPTLTLYLDGRVAEIEINVSSFESQIIIIIMIIIIISNIVSHLIQKIFFLTITQMTSSQMQHLSLFLLVHWEENETTWSWLEHLIID